MRTVMECGITGAGSEFVAPDHQPLEHRVMFVDAVTAGSTVNGDPHSVAEAVAQLGGLGGFLFGNGAGRFQGRSAEIVHEMANQALDHLLVIGLVHLHDFRDSAAPAGHDTDE